MLGGLAMIEIEPLDNPLVDLQGIDRVLAALAVATRYAVLLVVPARLSADYSFAAIDVSALPIVEIAGGLLLVALVVGAAWRFCRQPDIPGLAMVWLAICFAPLVNVLFPIGTILAERISYMPSVGYPRPGLGPGGCTTPPGQSDEALSGPGAAVGAGSAHGGSLCRLAGRVESVRRRRCRTSRERQGAQGVGQSAA